jgi:hypothetical protein
VLGRGEQAGRVAEEGKRREASGWGRASKSWRVVGGVGSCNKGGERRFMALLSPS